MPVPALRGPRGSLAVHYLRTTDPKDNGVLYLVTAFGFAGYILPLQIGPPDVAFPRLNALSCRLFLFGGLIVMAAFVTPGGAPTSAGTPTPR